MKSETVGNDAWSDLKVELPAVEKKAAPAAAPRHAAPAAAAAQKGRAKPQAADGAGEGQRVVVEFIVPEGQKWSEGV